MLKKSPIIVTEKLDGDDGEAAKNSSEVKSASAVPSENTSKLVNKFKMKMMQSKNSKEEPASPA